MARMHGENRQAYGARMQAKSDAKNAPPQVESAPVVMPLYCTCRSKATPHMHSLPERQQAVKVWNLHSKHKIPIPKA